MTEMPLTCYRSTVNSVTTSRPSAVWVASKSYSLITWTMRWVSELEKDAALNSGCCGPHKIEADSSLEDFHGFIAATVLCQSRFVCLHALAQTKKGKKLYNYLEKKIWTRNVDSLLNWKRRFAESGDAGARTGASGAVHMWQLLELWGAEQNDEYSKRGSSCEQL